MPRRFPIFQFPNPPLIAAITSAAVARGSAGETARGAAAMSDVALLVWAYRELTDGANWFRRLLGAGGAAYAVGALNSLRARMVTA
jgi:hypothetical protein